MSLREELARVIARDPRYTIEGYAFVLESLNLARNRKLKAMSKRERARQTRSRKKGAAEAKPEVAGHVTGRELCLSARRLAVRLFGSMAVIVLDQWGIRATSDIGDIVYNLIASGDLDKTPADQRSDFDDVFDFATALRPKALIKDENPQ